MKICFLANANSIHSQKLIKYFADKEHEIHWVSLSSKGNTDIKNVKMYYLEKTSNKLLNLLNVIRVRKLIKKINPDILHAHYAKKNGIIGALSGFHPFLLTAWGSDILLVPKKSKILKWFLKVALNKADLITCNAKHMREAIIKLGAEPSKVKIVQTGIDIEKFSSVSKDQELIKELKVQDSPVVISTRNFWSIYNVENLIRAVPLILRKLPKTKFVIVGGGEERERLENLAKHEGVFDSIRFVGWLPNEQIPRYLKISDIYVSTSLLDGSSMSLTEAMVVGIFPVVTDIPANREWIKDNVNGFLCPINDYNYLAKKILEALKDKDFRQTAIKKNQILAEEKESYQRNMELMEKYYFQLAQSKE